MKRMKGKEGWRELEKRKDRENEEIGRTKIMWGKEEWR